MDVLGRHDVLQLHPVDFNPPGICGFVQNGAHPGIDDISGGQRLVQLQLTNDVPQGGGGEVLNGAHGVFHPIGVELGVRDLEVEDRVDLDGDVVLGNDRLGWEVRHLFGGRDQ